jgi:thiol-disulfide isomerase/thioredoxin
VSSETGSTSKAWRIGASVSAGLLPYPTRVADNQPIADETAARLDVFLSLVSISIGKGIGPAFDVTLPFGALTRTDLVNGTKSDWGLGDVELRAKYSAKFGDSVRLQGALGTALNTGLYAPKSGIAAIVDNPGYLTLGRGVTWLIGEADIKVNITNILTGSVGFSARGPLANTPDGFHWGQEFRPYIQLATAPILKRISFSAQLELQLRAKSTELDIFTNKRADSVSTGGQWLTAIPVVQVKLTDNLSAYASVRIPLVQRLEGLQYAASVGGFIGLSGSFELPQQETVSIEEGQVTLVDYWADWCPPCKKLAPLIEAAQQKYKWLKVQKVDVTNWNEEQLDQLPGGEGLPVVEIFGKDKSRVARLIGPDVFQFERIILENQP